MMKMQTGKNKIIPIEHKTEYIKFELTMHFEPSLEGSIEDLKSQIRYALRNVAEVMDIELDTIESGRI
jgi:hypothetical protein